MLACPRCGNRLIQPPSISTLSTRFPALTLDLSLDRTLPRCQHCDEMLAHRHAIEAELPPPTYTNPIKKLKTVIQKIQDFIREDIEDQEDVRALELVVERMRRKWANMVREREVGIREAWKPYWATWGVMEGQEGL